MNNFEKLRNRSLEEVANERVKYDADLDKWVTDAGSYFDLEKAIRAEKYWLLKEVNNG